MYDPRFTYTNKIVDLLGSIERSRAVVDVHPLPVSVEKELRHAAKLIQVRYSTAIEGNTIALEHIQDIVKEKSDRTGSRAEQEVRNYWNALNFLARAKSLKIRISEDFIKRLHAIIETRGHGRREKCSSYRGEPPAGRPFVVSDSLSGEVAYRPPLWSDVPKLMREYVEWLNSDEARGIPGPVRAAIATYQFLTVHPFYDGNGRTGRALATYILNTSGYDLKGMYSFEEHYFADLQGYYNNLQLGLPPDYYMIPGRGKPRDLAPWITYFLEVTARAFSLAEAKARKEFKINFAKIHPLAQRPKERQLVTFLLQQRHAVTQKQIAAAFEAAPNQIGKWIEAWIEEGLLEPVGAAGRTRKYKLGSGYHQLTLESLGFVDGD